MAEAEGNGNGNGRHDPGEVSAKSLAELEALLNRNGKVQVFGADGHDHNPKA